ncbi:hypothetical protein [Chondromyces apiculatus]|uniref:Lipoprotein n=1 Tax=Chondromyces apiculatus DSM 436 TaxID=1192034 RepID=A0A017SVD9_9BACT|nr:hypothetical protein [Chondromyces apiculatus]EYF00732.1 Hypothetical protein CAP_0300 [Chondromyces apiculatus DSM 436]
MTPWTRRLACTALSTLAASALLHAGACTQATSPEPDDEDLLAGVIYRGGATDEALRALLAVAPEDVPAQAAVIDVPVHGATLTGATAPELRWHIRDAFGDMRLPDRRPPPNLPLPWNDRASSPLRRAFAPLLDLLGPEREARAHGSPLNGRGYLLVFTSSDDDQVVMRVFTSVLTYTPDPSEWERLQTAAQPLTLVITNAVFEDNVIAEDAGPFAGEPSTFIVSP